MSSSLIDTVPGGEDTPYEQENSDVKPHAKVAGQLGGTHILTFSHFHIFYFYHSFFWIST